MSASSPHGFVVVRRGYRPEQVDARVADLNEERGQADERATRLTILARELTEEAERLQHLVDTLPAQTYDTLGPRAQDLLTTAEAEAAELHATAEAEAQRTTEHADRHATAAKDAAREHSTRTRADADATATRALATARTAAGELHDAARAAAEEIRGEATDALEEMTRRCAGLLTDQEKEHTAENDALDRELRERESAVETRLADLDDHGRNLLAEAERANAEAEEAARHRQEDAEAQAAELLTLARAQEDRIQRDTDRILRDHEEQGEELRAHMAHVRSSLATLTGRGDDHGNGHRDEDAGDHRTTTEDGETESAADTEAEAHLPGQANRSD